MIPTIGRTVVVHGPLSNDSTEHPAVITRVFSARDTRDGPALVNLSVLPDMAPPFVMGSVPLFESEELARAARHGAAGSTVAWWPAKSAA